MESVAGRSAGRSTYESTSFPVMFNSAAYDAEGPGSAEPGPSVRAIRR